MPFSKAVPVATPAYFTVYGPPKTGKTLTSLLFCEGLIRETCPGKRIAFIDTELGTKTYRVPNPNRLCHPEAFDFDVIDTRSLSVVLAELKAFDYNVYGALIIDSWSHIWDAAREGWEAKHPGKDIELRDWGPLKKPYKEAMRLLTAMPVHRFINGRQKNIFERDDQGKMTNAGIGMRAEAETQFEPDTILRFESVVPGGLKGEGVGVATMFCEGDRYSILSGRTYPSPTFEVLRPMLPFLGMNAQPIEDDEERALSDGELITAGEDKAAKKAEKSSGLLATLQGALLSATTPEMLGTVGKEIQKQKRYMVEEHVGALRVIYEQRRADVTRSVVPESV